MREFRKSMAVDTALSFQTKESVKNSVARASLAFKLNDGCTDAGEIIIENERLKSTLLILN